MNLGLIGEQSESNVSGRIRAKSVEGLMKTMVKFFRVTGLILQIIAFTNVFVLLITLGSSAWLLSPVSIIVLAIIGITFFFGQYKLAEKLYWPWLKVWVTLSGFGSKYSNQDDINTMLVALAINLNEIYNDELKLTLGLEEAERKGMKNQARKFRERLRGIEKEKNRLRKKFYFKRDLAYAAGFCVFGSMIFYLGSIDQLSIASGKFRWVDVDRDPEKKEEVFVATLPPLRRPASLS